MPARTAATIAHALARMVGAAHTEAMVHRDLKPGNIFLENGTVKVGDYGLCKFISSSQHKAAPPAGSTRLFQSA